MEEEINNYNGNSETIDIFDMWQTLKSECRDLTYDEDSIKNFEIWYNSVSMELFKLYCNDIAEGKSDSYSSLALAPFLKHVYIVVAPNNVGGYDYVRCPKDFEYRNKLIVYYQKGTQKCGLNKHNIYPIIDIFGKTHYPDDKGYSELFDDFVLDDFEEREYQIIENKFWHSCLTHDIKKPSFQKPFATREGYGFNIAPKGINIIQFDYFSLPKKAVFARKINTDGSIIYDKSDSIQLQWKNSVDIQLEFLKRLKHIYNNMKMRSNVR